MVEKRALEFAIRMHKGQCRKDGSEYINHPIRVADYVRKYVRENLKILVASAYLHDTIEDTDTTYDDLLTNFGVEIADIVLELTTDKDLKNKLGKTRYLQKKMKNMTDLALALKLCDRLDNICDSINADSKFRSKYINETIDIINYLLDNRNLDKTHLILIEQILIKIKLLSNTLSEKNKEVEYLLKLVLTKDNK